MKILEYGIIEFESQKALHVYYDEAGVGYLKCRDIHKVLGLSSSAAYKHKEAGCFVRTSGNGGGSKASLARVDVLERCLYPNLGEGNPKQRLAEVFEILVDVQRCEFIEPSDASLSASLPVPLPAYPKFSDAEEISVYSANVETFLRSEHRLESIASLVSACPQGIQELPEGVSIDEVRPILRLTHDLWVATLQYRYASERFVSDPLSVLEVPRLPESSRELHGEVGMPLHPDVVDAFEGSSSAIEQEYDFLVVYVHNKSGIDYGIIKRQGYDALIAAHGLIIDGINGKKPVEVIRERGWWKEHYRALWSAYETLLRHIC